MLYNKTMRRISRVLAVCFMFIFCINGASAAFAATKLSGALEGIAVSDDIVSNSLYLSAVYQFKDGNYFAFVKDPMGYKQVLATSTDRITWTIIGKPGSFYWGKDILIAYVEDELALTTDGIDWKHIKLDGVKSISNVVYQNGKYRMQYRDEADSESVMFSADGVTWYAMAGDLPDNAELRSFSVMKDKYVVFSNANDKLTAASASEITEADTNWKALTLPADAKYFQSFDGNAFRVRGVDLYYTSTDGVNWESKEGWYANTEPPENLALPAAYAFGSGLDVKERVIGDKYYCTSYITFDGVTHEAKFVLNGKAIVPPELPPLAATPTASKISVNGQVTSFDAYLIYGNNFFKLRDLAFALNGTGKQFEVGYDNATKAITLTSATAYTAVGGEMSAGDGTTKTPAPTASVIFKDGRKVELEVYLIGGNNYFKLRDVMKLFNVGVTYDPATKNIGIDPSIGYSD